MATLSWSVIFLLLIANDSIQKSTPSSPSYIGAVVEFRPAVYIDDPVRTLRENLDKYLSVIEQAASREVDILVFPEGGLVTLDFPDRPLLEPWSTLIPGPEENFMPCRNSSIPVSVTLKTIACSVEKYAIYVMINLIEKEICYGDDCPTDGVFYYLSNVVFDRTGKIIARYRKYHQFDEFYLNVTKAQEYSIFETDFGVTFGNFICFDLMYDDPAVTLINKFNITDFVYDSAWFSGSPFQTTLQFQAGWSYARDVNFLASGCNGIEFGYSGSGIYTGRRGAAAIVSLTQDRDELMVAEVLKRSKQSSVIPTLTSHRLGNHKFGIHEDQEYHIQQRFERNINPENLKLTYESLERFENSLINRNGTTVKTLTQNQLICKFNVNVSELTTPATYRLVAFDGRTLHGKVHLFGFRICAIVLCANETLESCGRVQNSSAIFNSVTVRASYVDNENTLMMPSTLATDMFPMEGWHFSQQKHGGHMFTFMSVQRPTSNFITFGVMGRNFGNDIDLRYNRSFSRVIHLENYLIDRSNVPQ